MGYPMWISINLKLKKRRLVLYKFVGIVGMEEH